ncbi:MAG: T9SS type A sorting domain-containing protein, partial [Bacteroidota bacterium]
SYVKENLKSASNSIAPEDIEHIIEKQAKHLAGNGSYDDYTGWGLLDAGAALNGIKLPDYLVKHYIANFKYSSAVLFQQNVNINLTEGVNTNINPNSSINVPAQVYTGDIFKISVPINITQISGRGTLDVWPLNSLSSLYGELNNGNDLGAGEQCHVKPNWTQSSATVEGYIYHFKKDGSNNPVNIWLPTDASNPNNIGKMALTAYTISPFTNGVDEIDLKPNSIKIYPNPAKNSCIIEYNLQKQSDVFISIIDATGNTVYTMPPQKEHVGIKQYMIDTRHLSAGIYICNIITDSGIKSTKLIIE